MNDYPRALPSVDQIEPVPRRVRATLGGVTVLDTTRARYVFEWEFYPHFYIPLEDVNPDVLVDEGRTQHLRRGTAAVYSLKAGGQERESCVRAYGDDALEGIRGHVRFDWDALEAWYEEDEQVFVHARIPYVRVDALRSTRQVRLELDGVLLAESSSPVLVFETGLPTRYYVNRTEIAWEHLLPSATETACPYKGVTSAYWSVNVGDSEHPDLAWAYDFPTRVLLPIAGLVAFYNEKVDIIVDGIPLDRARTHFFKE